MDQIPRTPAEIAARFKGAKAELIARHLDTLALLGEARRSAPDNYRSA